ncbi:MAG TPA: hypothetical protein VMT58_07270 [Candidatus Binataceae bacterium]|nr:hypothetical protein [Candidatus Binataceae bacterium]
MKALYTCGKIARCGTMVSIAAAIAACIAIAPSARATDVKVAGKLTPSHGVAILPICTDPVVQNVLSEDLRVTHNSEQGRNTTPVTLTVSLNQRLLAPGVSLTELFPGDPEMAELLKAAGADPPPLGDTGDQPIDPYAQEARRQALNPDDSMTAGFRNYQAQQMTMRGANAPTPYDSIPKDQIYDTVIVARATLGTAPDELKVVALVHSGDDLRKAKELVAEEIANAVLR